jgi:hypothetical protein
MQSFQHDLTLFRETKEGNGLMLAIVYRFS